MKRHFLSLLILGCVSGAQAYQPVPHMPPPYPVYAAYPPPVYGYAPPVYRPYVPWQVPAYASPPVRPVPQPQSVPTRQPAAPAIESKTVDEPAGSRPALSERQQAFLEQLAPIVERENARLTRLRGEVRQMLLAAGRGDLPDDAASRLRQLAGKYRVKGKVMSDAAARQDLLERIDTIPPELALAQAANESAWGTSRFAREGNNLFGIWTYDKDKGIVPRNRPQGATHLVRRFDSFEESVRYYLYTLNSHPAYQDLREARAAARERGGVPSGEVLAGGLTRYSAKGELYVKLIRDLIKRVRLASIALQGVPRA